MSKISKLLIGLLFFAAATLTVSVAGRADSDKDAVVLSKDNLIVLVDEVDGESVGKAISQARKADSAKNKLRFSSKNAPLYMFLDTPGGSIQAGLELIEALQGLNRPIHTVTLFSASMGFQIAQNLNDRLILKNGVMMSHHAHGMFSGNFGGHGSSQMDSRYGLWLTRMTELDNQTVKRTNGKQTLESYQKAYDHELWLDGNQSVAQGYADKVVSIKCDETLDGVTTNTVWFLGFKITYDLDNCPLNRSPMNVQVTKPSKEDDKTEAEKKEEKKKEEEKKKKKGAEEERNFDDSYGDVKAKFLESYFQKRRIVVPMHW